MNNNIAYDEAVKGMTANERKYFDVGYDIAKSIAAMRKAKAMAQDCRPAYMPTREEIREYIDRQINPNPDCVAAGVTESEDIIWTGLQKYETASDKLNYLQQVVVEAYAVMTPEQQASCIIRPDYLADVLGTMGKERSVAQDKRPDELSAVEKRLERLEQQAQDNASEKPKFTGKFAGLNDIIGAYGQTDGERLKELLQYMRMQYQHEENKRTGKYTGAFEGLNNIII